MMGGSTNVRLLAQANQNPCFKLKSWFDHPEVVPNFENLSFLVVVAAATDMVAFAVVGIKRDFKASSETLLLAKMSFL